MSGAAPMAPKVPPPRTGPPGIAASLREQGYVVLEGLFEAHEMAAAVREARRVVAREQGRRRAIGRAAGPPGFLLGASERSPIFRGLSTDPRLVDRLVEAVGPNLEFWFDKLVYRSPQVRFGTPWHQDWPYWEGAHKHSVWLALSATDARSGQLRVVPGSHRAALGHRHVDEEGGGFGFRLPCAAFEASRAVAIDAAAGTAVVLHDRLVHSSTPYLAGPPRWSLVASYRDASLDDYDYGFARSAVMLRGERTGRCLGRR